MSRTRNMMSEWTPLHIYVYSVFLSAVTAVGALLISDRPLTIRALAAAIVFHGSIGGAVGMAAYEIWPKHSWRAIGAATLYGGGYIEIRKMLDRLLQLLEKTNRHE